MSIEALKEQARGYEQNEDWDKALQAYVEAINRQSDEDQPDLGLYNRAGDLSTRLGDPIGAITHYEQAVELYLESELPNNAIAILKKILRNMPNRAAVYLRMGQIRAGQGFLTDARDNFLIYAEHMQQSANMEEAFRALSEFAELAPEDTEIRLTLAEQFRAHEKHHEALEQFIRAHQTLSSRGDTMGAASIEERIREIDPDAVIPAASAMSDPSESYGSFEHSSISHEADSGVEGEIAFDGALDHIDHEADEADPDQVEEDSLEAAPVMESSPGEIELGNELDDFVIGSEAEAAETLLAAPAVEHGGDDWDALASTPEPTLEDAYIDFEASDDAATEDAVALDAATESESEWTAPSEGESTAESDREWIAESDDEWAAKSDDEWSAESSDELTADTTVEATGSEEGWIADTDRELVDEDIEIESGASLDDAILDFEEAVPAIDSFAEDDIDGRPEAGLSEREIADEGTESGDWQSEAVEAFSDTSDESLDDPIDESIDADMESDLPLLSFDDDGADQGTASEVATDTAVAVETSSDTEAFEHEADPDDEWIGLEESAAVAADSEAGSESWETGTEFELESVRFDALGEDELREYIESNPGSGQAQEHLGRLVVARGDHAGATEAFEAAHLAHAESRDFHSAMRTVRELLLVEPDSVAFHQRLVEYAHRGDDRTLLVSAFLELGDCLGRTGAPEKADAVYQKVLDVDPGNRRAQSALGVVAAGDSPEEDGDGPEGGNYVDLGALVLEKREKTTRWTVEAQEPTNEHDFDFQHMLKQFRAKVAEHVDVNDVQAHYDLGTAYKEMGLLDEAISEFQQALRADGQRLATFELLGQSFMEKGQPEVAIRTLKRATELPFDVEDELLGIYYYLGRAHEELGNREDAVEYYEKVFALDINFEDVTERLRSLR